MKPLKTKLKTCLRKRQFDSFKRAKEFTQGYMHPYKCNVCHKYHLTKPDTLRLK